jgi:uncharacterized membrane protein YgdD (TMEM256/DUF423 family)
MDRRLVLLAAVTGFLSVALGAFGAHALVAFVSGMTDAADRLRWWDKAVHYHQIHALLVLALAVWPTDTKRQGALRRRACIAALIGILVFSGSLYTMALTGIRVLGAVTPIGGVAFLSAWALAGFAALSAQDA